MLFLFKEIDGALRIAKNLNSSKNLLNFINLYTSDNSTINDKIDILITGTLNDISNRIIAFNLRKFKKIKKLLILHMVIIGFGMKNILKFPNLNIQIIFYHMDPRKISQKISKKFI